MKICYIGDANSIHIKRWIAPFIERDDKVHLISYKPVYVPWSGLYKLIDLTGIFNFSKIRLLFWGCWIHRYVNKITPDILHAHQIQAAGWLGVMAKYHPFVISAWGSDILVEPHKSSLRRMFVNQVLKSCDSITVPTDLMYKKALDLGMPEVKTYLIPWGIETDIFKPGDGDVQNTRRKYNLPEDRKIILCSRGVSRIYNLDILVEAFGELAKEDPTIILVIIEKIIDQSYHSELYKMITEKRLQKKVFWIPATASLHEMASLYRASDLVVSIPSSEGYGFTVYEAMASGTPTVITDLPVFAEEIKNERHTLKVPVRDVQATIQAFWKILNEVELTQNMCQHALRICISKNVSHRVEETIRLYESLKHKLPSQK
jgi:glycosyltransferase involved in cell wall biosynthesis